MAPVEAVTILQTSLLQFSCVLSTDQSASWLKLSGGPLNGNVAKDTFDQI